MIDLPELLRFVQELTHNDPKTLLEKYAKVGEESGELSKVLMPYANAAGTLHRFVGRRNITEEVADTMLALYSIVHSVGVSDEELLAMLYRKAQKWQSIQVAEKFLKNPSQIPFEIHISMVPDGSWGIDEIRRACERVGVKYTELLLMNPSGTRTWDWMTSSTFLGTNEGAMREMERISSKLEETRQLMAEASFEGRAPFSIVRNKIETVPWHPAAPQKDGPITVMPKDCYFEKHFEYLIWNEDEYIEKFARIVHDHGGMVSMNTRKPPIDGQIRISATIRRADGTREQFESIAQGFASVLPYKAVDSIAEFSIYDTNLGHDANWVTRFADVSPR